MHKPLLLPPLLAHKTNTPNHDLVKHKAIVFVPVVRVEVVAVVVVVVLGVVAVVGVVVRW